MSALPRLDVVDVDDVVDVVVLQDHLLLLDERLRPRDVEGVEGRAEVGVDVLVAVVQGQPVEPHLDEVPVLVEDLHVARCCDRFGARAGSSRSTGRS